MLKSALKVKNNSAGYFLLEVLIAISILAIGAASSVRVFGQSSRVQQRIVETQAGKSASESLLFKLVSGELSEVLSKKGGWKKGSIPMPDLPPLEKLNYEILAEQIESPKSSSEASKQSPAAKDSLPRRGFAGGFFEKKQKTGSASGSGGGESADIYQVEIKIFTSAGKEIYNTKAIVRNETTAAFSKPDESPTSLWDKRASPFFPRKENTTRL